MSLSAEAAAEHLARMVRVIRGDRTLRRWFDTLRQMNPRERRCEVHVMSEKMYAEGKPEDLILSFRLLAEPAVFDAAASEI